MTRFVALGDSITLGVGDPVRCHDPATGRTRRRWRGFAALLAAGLPEPVLHNLAGNGACSADVELDQLPRALELRPDLASVVVGVNDTLRPGFDPDKIAAAAAHTIGALRAAGADVLTLRLPDPGRMLGAPAVLARPLARRAHQVNAALDELAWLATKGTGWVVRRSTDLVPSLLGLAFAEWRAGRTALVGAGADEPGHELVETPGVG